MGVIRLCDLSAELPRQRKMLGRSPVTIVEPRLCLKQSPLPGNRISRPRDNSPEIRWCTELVSAETEPHTAKPANSGPAGSRQEISGVARLRGGPERTSAAKQCQQLTLANVPHGSFDP